MSTLLWFVSFVNSLTYAISGYLARILSLVVGNTDYTVKNSCELADFIRDKTLNACKELLSFDVVSLFTKIPVDLAVKVAEERLREDASLGQRTSLPVEDIIHLLSFCLKTTQFAYNGTYSQQVFGTAMGSPVFAVIANIVTSLHRLKPFSGNDMSMMLFLWYPEMKRSASYRI